ncbi:MAG: OmpA family protein [Alphaproteobacteria bacterium]|nr:OmpA family protein [Alphaproteobacteria bacterium]
MLKNTLLASALGLSVYALAASAEAGHRPMGWYVGVEGGANWIDNADVEFNTGFGGTTFEADFDSGWALFAEVGYRWENNWRLELEAGWRKNDVDCVSFGGPCIAGNWGDVSQFTQMVNIVHDIDITEHTAISAGLGFGGNFVEVDSPFLNDEDFVLAGQALFQITHELNERLDFVLTYRFMTSADPEFDFIGPVSAQFENENHTVTVGLRFDLQADAAPVMAMETPAVEPPAPPSQPKQYIVYFGFNKANLNAKAQAVVEEAAATAMHDGFVSILVTGHTDTVGSNAYNERLSARRAGAVKKALVAQGVTEKAISTQGKGETVLMVQTGDREMEAQNRRATIDIN